MAVLSAILTSARKRFATSSYIPNEKDPVAIHSQMAWRALSSNKRAELISRTSIHLRNSDDVHHPFPVCEEITSWRADQLELYFDVYANVGAEDQTWIPKSHYGKANLLSPVQYAMDVPRKRLYSALQSRGKGIPVPLVPDRCPGIDRWVDMFPADIKEPDDKIEVTVQHLEEDSNARDRCSSIEQFLYSLKRTEQLQTKTKSTTSGVLFMKHVPLVVPLPLLGLDSFGHISRNESQQTNASKPPIEQMCFAQLMSPTAMARTHIAPNGFAKHIRVVLGEIAVFVATLDNEEAEFFCTDTTREERFARRLSDLPVEGLDSSELDWDQEVRKANYGSDSFRPVLSVRHGFQEAAMNWHMVLLRPGDDLFIRPNTPHCVVALQPALTVCGLFYSASNLDRTMIAMTVQHYYGHLCVRDNQLSIAGSCGGILFIRMLSYWRQVIQRNQVFEDQGKEPPSNPV